MNPTATIEAAPPGSDTARSAALDHRRLYRLPWTLPDNAISWLEPTAACNLACDGCYRENMPDSHLPLEKVKSDIDTFHRLRNADGISISGGDPLMHPDIVEIVRYIAGLGIKPIINTNGARLTPELLKTIKAAGACGFTFHIDSKQGRPGWKDKNEVELNELRLHYARMLAEAGDLSCSFNSTVYEDTLQHVPELVAWAEQHIEIVQVMVFILYRAAIPHLPFDWYSGGQKVELGGLAYALDRDRRIDIKGPEVVAEIRRRFPDFTPCAYLNGTEQADSFKWLLTGRLGTRGKVHGYVGPRFMELMQAGHHFLKGRYMAYARPKLTSLGRTMLLMSPFDAGLRSIAGNYTRWLLTHPQKAFHKLCYQSIMIIQPIDFLPDGAQNMCDGCPDVTVWDGKLVWSCRLEELKRFGQWVNATPRE